MTAGQHHPKPPSRDLRWGTDYGQAQHVPSDPQKSKLLGQALTLPFDPFLSPVGIDYLVNQAWEIYFSYVSSLARNDKLTLEKGDLLSHLVSLSVCRI
jgi:hypothetical protein